MTRTLTETALGDISTELRRLNRTMRDIEGHMSRLVPPEDLDTYFERDDHVAPSIMEDGQFICNTGEGV